MNRSLVVVGSSRTGIVIKTNHSPFQETILGADFLLIPLVDELNKL